ncbi:MAG: four helix bundle protein [Candidatus Marinimicrobia bacterium]|nr:four helix bundle protein [Candidatus Neomarinimicrobiota bacterium]
MSQNHKFNLEERLINFSVEMINLTKSLEKSYASNYLGKQLLRSSTSPALNYGEAQSAESRKDFIHKIKIVLKELRESHINLNIIEKTDNNISKEKVNSALNECNELISIFVKSVETAQKNVTS